LAGQALRAAGETDAADAARGFVLGLALGCDAAPADVGAIAWTAADPGFLVFSTPQAVLALGAGRLDQLSIEGAAGEAPVLDCPAAPIPSPPSPVPSSTAAPTIVVTPPPTDAVVQPTPASPPVGLALGLFVLAATAGSCLVVAIRSVRRA
jgi:hypothetical protein